MKTFRISNGDLVLTGGSFEEVTGEAKVRQDLGVAVREPFGADRFHPQWGSLLDRFVGAPFTLEVKSLVKAEVMRIISSYSADQQAMMRNDTLANRKSRFSSGEIVQQVTGIEVAQNQDTLHVRVRLQTLTSAEVVLSSSVRI